MAAGFERFDDIPAAEVPGAQVHGGIAVGHDEDTHVFCFQKYIIIK